MPILLILLPLLAAIPIAFLPAERAKWVATGATSVTFVVSIIAALRFGDRWTDGSFGFLTEIGWLETVGVTLNMHADSVSMMLVLLTTFLMPLCVIGSFSAITTRQKEYYAWLLILQAAMTGVFFAKDLIFFYVCFEFTLVPMFFLIALYGGDNRAAASIKFFLYTFTGSLITLAALLWTAWSYAEASGSWAMAFDIPTLTEHARTLPLATQAWLLLGLMAGFAVKVPLFPVHTWLPLAHTEAPTAGSVILAGVLLKLGTYGIYRFILPMLPDAVAAYAPAIGVLAVIAILYAALICWVQDDVKKLVAYSSVSHLGFCVLGLFALNPMGLQGSVLYMINHGLSTGALFLLIGMMYERYHTRDMNRVGGLGRKMPVWATFMVFFVLSSVGLPGLNGFVSEFLCLIAAFTATGDAGLPYPGMLGPWFAAFAGVGMILAAMYLLIMTGKVVFGPLKEPDAGHDGHDDHGDLPADLSPREIGVLVPLAVLCVVFGLQPGILTDRLERPVEILLVDAGYPDAVRAQLEQREDAPARMAEDETPAAPDGATAAADAADAVDAAAAADAADPAAATPAELVLTGDAPATPFELVEEPVDG
jgi:NADH-quinone oxidoreductase subunit M